MQETNMIIESIGTLPYGGMFLLALMANMLVPIPEEFLLLISGYLTGTGNFNYFITAAIFIVGMYISDIVLFYFSRRGNKYITKLKERVKNKNFLRDENFIKTHIKKIIFISRFLVYIRFIGPVISGSIKTKWSVFLFYDLIALLVYVPLVLLIGNYFHEHISAIIHGVAKGKNYILLVIISVLLIILARYINKKFIKDISKKIDRYIPTIIPGLSIKKTKDDIKKNQK